MIRQKVWRRRRASDEPFRVRSKDTGEEFEKERLQLERIMTQSMLMDCASVAR
jgi:hypothetical protein